MGDAPGFMLFHERGPLLACLTDEQAGRVIKAAFAYADTGEIPAFEQSEMMMFLALKGDIGRSHEKYEVIREQNRINGAKGGAPTGNQNARKNNRSVE